MDGGKFEGKRPFIVALLAVDFFGQEYVWPAGIVLATDEQDAWGQAKNRWPENVILQPRPWEEVPSELRLVAIRND